MKIIFVVFCFGLFVLSIFEASATDITTSIEPAAQRTHQKNPEDMHMQASGTFDVELTPQEDDIPAGRMLIQKTYHGGLSGTGAGQMINKRTESGTATYSAIEEFYGSLDGISGSFTLIHQGFMSAESQTLEILILEGSGSGELKDISGSMTIVSDDGDHKYELDYSL